MPKPSKSNCTVGRAAPLKPCQSVIEQPAIDEAQTSVAHPQGLMADDLARLPGITSVAEVDPRRLVELNADDFFNLDKFRI